MSDVIVGDGFGLRRAKPEDAEFLASLAMNEEVAPFLAAVSARDPDAFLEEIERSERSPRDFGRFVIDVETETGVWAAGSIAFEVANRRSRVANLFGLMLRPDFRGRGLAEAATRGFTRYLIFELNFHRVQLECYGFNTRAIRHFRRAGFVREGVKRKAYWRHDEWVDGVLFGLIREDLETEEG